ncbi:hypothetical protein [Isoptericola sp. BMS4]|uniref:hypothetical protein n=1 Tax=Isoptericola sp. BMS4 TaxID=2527875 RepID=UPI00141EB029|nr:hypothetical protein [Isoptericola sp. BMS4]
MTVRAVALPATPLLVRGAAGAEDVLTTTRERAATLLGRLLDDAGGARDLLVVAPLPRGATPPDDAGPAPRRPSLAGAGIPDRWLPDLDGWPRAGAAHVPASVALLTLGRALVARGEPGRRGAVGVIELPADAPPSVVARAVASVRAAAATVLAWSPGPSTQPVAEIAAALVAEAGWVPETTATVERGDHLPGRYELTAWREDRRERGSLAG